VQTPTNAGVDMLLFDTSNGRVYEKTVAALCDTFNAMRETGMMGHPKQIDFQVGPPLSPEGGLDRFH
jgi:hypothetical protein